jgi:hypothetical protein
MMGYTQKYVNKMIDQIAIVEIIDFNLYNMIECSEKKTTFYQLHF